MAINTYTTLAKLAGAATAGILAYDAHRTGVMTGRQNVKVQIGDSLPDSYIQSRRQDDLSFITKGFKDRLFKEDADWSFIDKVNACTGYLSGSFDQLSSNLFPLLLSVGALAAHKSGEFLGKSKLSIACGIGLAVCGLKYLICDVLDLGRVKYFSDSD